MKVLIRGALGFMGREVAKACKAQGIEVIGGVDIAEGSAEFPLHKTFATAPVADVVIDFSKPDDLPDLLAYATGNNVPAVLCTTGYDDAQIQQINEAAQKVALFRSGNMSLGVALLRALARKAAAFLGDGYDIEIVEAHHNRKVDAPSGTALMLYEAVKQGCESPREASFGRHGRDCKRQPQEIGIHAVRGGTITGEHQVGFYGPSERIVLSHSAENRALFANGAIRAAEFLAGKPAGLYSMDDVVGDI